MIEKLLGAMGIEPKAFMAQVEGFQKLIVDFGIMFRQTSEHFDRKLSDMDARHREADRALHDRLARIEAVLHMEPPTNGYAALVHDVVNDGDKDG